MKRVLFSLLIMATVLSAVGAGSLAYFSDTETSSGNTFSAGVWLIEVKIDIRPEGFPNPINPGSGGVIPVAILTTADFNAVDVNPDTVRFGPAGAVAFKSAMENGDMILHFETQKTGITAVDTQAELVGETVDGIDIHGSDSVKIVP